MSVTITFRQMESSDALKQYVEKRLQKLEKFKDKAVDTHVVMSVENYRHVAEIHYTAAQFTSVGKSETPDMYQSIDEAVDIIEKQLKKHHAKKTKERTHPSLG